MGNPYSDILNFKVDAHKISPQPDGYAGAHIPTAVVMSRPENADIRQYLATRNINYEDDTNSNDTKLVLPSVNAT